MPLVLRIENKDTLPDGGPVSMEIDRRGIDIGRDPYLDWTLPDPERFISGKHCELRYRDGGYWLHDVSTNGTTMNGRPGRLTEPHRLEDGDRITIGQYIIGVTISGEQEAAPPASSATPGADPWGDISDAAEAVDTRDFAARARAPDPSLDQPRGPTDLAEENISWSMGEVKPAPPEAPADDLWSVSSSLSDIAGGGSKGMDWDTPASSDTSGSTDAVPPDWRAALGSDPAPADTPAAAPPAAPPVAEPVPPPDPEPAREELSADGSDLFAPPEPADPSLPPEPAGQASAAPHEPDPVPAPEPSVEAEQPAAPEPTPKQEPGNLFGRSRGLASQWADGETEEAPAAREKSAPAAPAAAGEFIAAFERGAGLPAGAVWADSEEAFAEQLGTLMAVVAESLRVMLRARAETKSAMRSSERTMIGALENNALKFSPNAVEAMRIMFGEKTRSYLDAHQTLNDSFADLQKHQMQTFGAMQQALQALIEDLDPELIAGATEKEGGLAGLVSSHRAKLWDTYVERYKAKSARHERGMVDAFMILFSDMYDRQR